MTMLKIKIPVLTFILTCAVTVSFAQNKNTVSPWKFRSINNVGLLEGQTGSAFQLQTVNGAQFKSWFGGIGLGLDYYRYRTIPFFFDLRKEFGKNSNKLFLYSDLGSNFSWATDKQKMSYVTDDKFSNGFYCDFGLGYKVTVKKNNAFLISLGYTFKKVVETYQSPTYTGYYTGYYYTGFQTSDLNLNGQQKINNSLNRLSIKIGWEF